MWISVIASNLMRLMNSIAWTTSNNRGQSIPFETVVKNRWTCVTKHARKVILTLDSRIQEQFDGLFWRAWERLNALWQ
ncbi:hypothetical protein [Weissella cibaria]|uniref:hypothetical protein n=1 Tax=Weissella cibaria TaxID=137591 RepID=UPI000706D7CF|nr:hypothetical protein [Weissella cibaria]ALI34156.1 hypothetical protein AO080_11975 [Weissella cibaria]